MKMKRPSRIVRREMVQVRRSSRVANLPAPVYKEIVTYERHQFPRIYSCKKRDLNRVSASDEVREKSITKAEELESSLGTDYPTFIRPMLPSHVAGGFWLGLPVCFCRENLPSQGATVVLVDENGEEYPTVYLAHKKGLSGGWRGFSISHGLVDGDALVFQLIRPTVFKVFIVRADSFEEGDSFDD